MKTTLITHIYNEEYLLPLWLSHHRPLFDNLVVIDYRCTDSSLQLCRDLWDGCTIIPTRNAEFDAAHVDSEVMDIERTIPGIKMVLNTTEFLFCETPITSLFMINPASYSVIAVSPYSNTMSTFGDGGTLVSKLLGDDVSYNADRGCRQIHSFTHGNYTLGRHGTNNPTRDTGRLHIVWLGYFPMSDELLKRKCQITISSRDRNAGYGIHHTFPRERLLEINNQKVNTGTPLSTCNPAVYRMLTSRRKLD